MRDAGKARRSVYNSVSEDLIQKHPKMFNIFLALVLISLIAMGAFLLSDILSFKSNTSHKGLFSGLDLKIHQGTIKTVESWQEISISLIDQFKSILGINPQDNTKAKKAVNSSKARALMAKNKVSKTKETHASVKNLSHQVALNSSNSSRTPTVVQSVKEASAPSDTIIGSADFDSGSDTPVRSVEDNPSKDNSNSVAHPADEISSVPFNSVVGNQPLDNDFQINETQINESVSNETQMNESQTNESQVNESLTNQTQISESLVNETQMNETQIDEFPVNDSQVGEPQTKESQLAKSRMNQTKVSESQVNETRMNDSQISKSLKNESKGHEPKRDSYPISGVSSVLPEAKFEGNDSRSNSDLFISGKPNHSFDNISSGSTESARPQTNSTTSIPTEIEGRIASDKNSSTKSVPGESDRINNKTYSSEKDSYNLTTKGSATRHEKAQNESTLSKADKKDKLIPIVTKARNSNISINNTSHKPSNIGSNKVNKSLERLEGNSNSAESSTRVVLAKNDTSNKIQEPYSGHGNNLTKNGQNQGKPSLSSLPLVNNGTGISQNHSGANSKNVINTKVSNQSQESQKKQTNNGNRFRTLKVPTPPWMKKK